MSARTRNIIIIAAAAVLLCVLFVFGVMVGAAVIGYRAAIHAGNEAATLQNVKTIGMVEAQYFHTHNRSFATIEQLINEQGLSRKFSGHPVVADGYIFSLELARRDGASWYKISADPQDESSGRTHFYLDSSDERIHVNAERQAGPSDPVN